MPIYWSGMQMEELQPFPLADRKRIWKAAWNRACTNWRVWVVGLLPMVACIAIAAYGSVELGLVDNVNDFGSLFKSPASFVVMVAAGFIGAMLGQQALIPIMRPYVVKEIENS